MRLSLKTDRFHYGESVTGTLHLEETTGSCKALLLRLWWAARGPEVDTDELVVATETLVASGTLSQGATYDFSIPRPLHPLSHDGHLISVQWALTARIQWTADEPDTTVRVPLTVAPGHLPDRAKIAAEWTKAWKKHYRVSLFDRFWMLLKKQPLRLSNTTASPGELVQLSFDDRIVPHHWELVRIEEAARRRVISNHRSGERTVYRWTVIAKIVCEGQIPLLGEPNARRATVTIPPDITASLLLPTRRIRWEIRVSTVGQDLVAPLVILPG